MPQKEKVLVEFSYLDPKENVLSVIDERRKVTTHFADLSNSGVLEQEYSDLTVFFIDNSLPKGTVKKEIYTS